MELDSLKDIWKQQDEQPAYPDSDEQIQSMLRKKSQSPIAKMKRNLQWELFGVVAIYSLTIWHYSTSWHGRYWEIAVLLFLVGVACVIYYYRKNKLLKQMQCHACEVKSNLQHQLTILEKYIRFYYISIPILTPAVYYVAGLIIFFKTPPTATGDPLIGSGARIQPIIKHIADHRYFTEFIVSGLVLSLVAYFVNGWYLNKMYGQHVNRLKDLLRQMDDTD